MNSAHGGFWVHFETTIPNIISAANRFLISNLAGIGIMGSVAATLSSAIAMSSIAFLSAPEGLQATGLQHQYNWCLSVLLGSIAGLISTIAVANYVDLKIIWRDIAPSVSPPGFLGIILWVLSIPWIFGIPMILLCVLSVMVD